MFYSDFEDEQIDDIASIWERYLQYKISKSGYFSEEEVVLIIEALDNKNQWDEALDFINVMIAFYPLSSSLKIKKADILISLDFINEAKEILSQLMDYETKEVDYYILSIEIEIILEKEHQIKQWIKKAKSNLEKEEYIELIQELVELLETYDMAEEVFYCLSTLLNEDHIPEELLILLPLYTEKSREFKKAVHISNALLRKNPYNIYAWICNGIAYAGQKKYEEAVDAFLYATAINQQLHEVWLRIASCYIKMRKFKDACDILLDYIAQKQNDVTALKTVAFCYAKQQQYSLARYYYEIALQESPTDHTILSDIAQTYLDNKEYYHALSVLKKILLISSKVPYCYHLIAHCYYELGEFEESIRYYSLALTGNLKKKTYWEGILKSLVKIKNYEQLYAMSLQALQHTQKHYFLYYLAYAEYKMGYENASRQSLEKAIRFSPSKYRKVSLSIPLGEISRPTSSDNP